MTPEVQQYLHMYQTTQEYLKLSPGYCGYLGGVRWSDREDALVYPDGRLAAFNERVAEFLEGFHSGGRLVAFSYVLHWLDLLQNMRELAEPQVQRLAELFGASGRAWRNAGAFAAQLTQSVPEEPDAPQLELICRRLCDRAFPIRWYAARFHDSPLVPPLPPEQFEALVLRQLAAYSDQDLRDWFETGRGPLRQAGEQLVSDTPQPRSLAGIIAELLQRPRLAGAETYVSQLVAALAIPPRRLTPEELPLGGYADMVTHGQVEHLLPSQHALEDLEFLRRFAERELLYFRREDPPAHQRQELAVLLDQGVRTWGDVRLVLAAAALALARQAQLRHVPFRLATTSGGGHLVDLLEQESEALASLIEASDLSLDPGLALETLLEQPSDSLRDIILLTEPRNLREPDLASAARRLRPHDRLFALTLDRHGHAEMSELRRGAPVRLRQFHVDFVPAPAPPAPAALAGGGERDWRGAVEPVPLPFRVGGEGSLTHFDFDHDARHLLTVTGAGLLHLWGFDGAGPSCLPRPFHDGQLVQPLFGVTGVAAGLVAAGRAGQDVVLAHYDLVRRTCTVRVVCPSRQMPAPQLYYLRELHCVVISDEPLACAYAYDLDTWAEYSRAGGGADSRARTALLHVLDERPLQRGRVVALAQSEAEFQRGAQQRPAICHIDSHSGTLRLQGKSLHWPPVVPRADGQPLLKGASAWSGQLAGTTLALNVLRDGRAQTLVLRGPHGAVVREYPHLHDKYRVLRFALSTDGDWIALQRSDQRIHVDSLSGKSRGLTTRQGGLPGPATLYVGTRHLLLCLGRKRQFWHLLDWTDGVLSHAFERGRGDTQPDPFTRTMLAEGQRRFAVTASAATLPPLVHYDRQRFTAGGYALPAPPRGATVMDVSAGVPPAALSAAIDRYGQVVVLDASQRVVCMFMAQRDHIAGWLPDGTRFGGPALSVGKPSSNWPEKFGRALRAAAQHPS